MGLKWRKQRYELELAYYAEIHPLKDALTEGQMMEQQFPTYSLR